MSLVMNTLESIDTSVVNPPGSLELTFVWYEYQNTLQKLPVPNTYTRDSPVMVTRGSLGPGVFDTNTLTNIVKQFR
jgi:hypothetical protein